MSCIIRRTDELSDSCPMVCTAIENRETCADERRHLTGEVHDVFALDPRRPEISACRMDFFSTTLMSRKLAVVENELRSTPAVGLLLDPQSRPRQAPHCNRKKISARHPPTTPNRAHDFGGRSDARCNEANRFPLCSKVSHAFGTAKLAQFLMSVKFVEAHELANRIGDLEQLVDADAIEETCARTGSTATDSVHEARLQAQRHRTRRRTPTPPGTRLVGLLAMWTNSRTKRWATTQS